MHSWCSRIHIFNRGHKTANDITPNLKNHEMTKQKTNEICINQIVSSCEVIFRNKEEIKNLPRYGNSFKSRLVMDTDKVILSDIYQHHHIIYLCFSQFEKEKHFWHPLVFNSFFLKVTASLRGLKRWKCKIINCFLFGSVLCIYFNVFFVRKT